MDLALSWSFLGLYVVMGLLRAYFTWRAGRSRTAAPIEEAIARRVLLYLLIAAQVLVNTLYGFWAVLGFCAWFGVGAVTIAVEIRIAGGAVAGLGLLGMIWTHRSLGRQFSRELVVQKQHELITRGPYAYVRHPLYTFLIMFFVGTAVLASHWANLGLCAALVALLVSRIPVEERMMSKHFGEKYAEYRQRTGALLPRLRKP